MNGRIVLRCFLLGALSLPMTGCTTYMLVNRSDNVTEDTFIPRAIYQATNGGNFALEGKLSIYNPRPDRIHTRAQADSYFLLPPSAFGPEPFPTNGNLALAKIRGLPLEYTVKNGKVESRLPASCVAICVLPTTAHSVVVTKIHHTGRLTYALLPATIAIDVAFLPFSAIGYYAVRQLDQVH